MMIKIVQLLVGVLSTLLLVAPAWSAEQYPTKPITVIVPYGAGGNMEMWRPTLKKLSDMLGQPVILQNKPGAGGTIGTEVFVRAPADGYTLEIGTIGTHAIDYSMYPTVTYKPSSFAPISLLAKIPDLMSVNSSVPAHSVKEFIKLAKAHPGKFKFGSPGVGSSSHLVGELFNEKAGVKLVHVPYKGSSEQIVDLIAGRVQVTFGNIPLQLPYIKSGKLRALAVTTEKRSPQLPDVPTLGECCFPGFAVSSWHALYGLAGTPQPVIDKLSKAIVKILRMPEIRNPLIKQGWIPIGSSPEELAQFTAQEVERWTNLVKSAGIHK